MPNVPPWHGAMALAARRGGPAGAPTFPRIVPMVAVNSNIGLRWDIPADSSRIILAFSFNASYGNASTLTEPTGNFNILNKQFIGNAQSIVPASNSEITAGFDEVFDNSAGIPFRVNGNNNVANPSAQASAAAPTTLNSVTEQLVLVADSNYGAGLKRLSVAKNGVKILGGWTDAIGSAAFNMNLSQVLGFVLNQLQFGGWFFIGDLWCHTVSADIPAASVDAANNIDPALLSKFWAAGQPQDLSVTKPLGLAFNQTQIVHVGPKATFPTNQGMLTVHTQLTNQLEPGFYDAPLNFGEAQAFPFARWPTPTTNNNANYNVMPYVGITNYGNEIKLNDYIEITIRANPNGTSNYNFGLAGSSGVAYADVPGTRLNILAGARAMNFIKFWKIADAADVTAPNGVWGNPPNVTWTTGLADPFFEWAYSVMVYGNVHAAGPIFASGGQINGGVLDSPNVATPAGNSLAVFTFGLYSWDDPTVNVVGAPNNANQNLRFALGTPGGNNVFVSTSWTGGIVGNLLTVTAMTFTQYPITVGMPVSGAGVTAGTAILAMLTGSGGVGTYLVDRAQAVGAGTAMNGTPGANATSCVPMLTDERYTTNAGTGVRTMRQTNATIRNNAVGVTVLLPGP